MGRYAVCSRDDAEVRDDEHGVPRAGLDQAPHRPREIDYRPVTDHDVSIRLCTEKSNPMRVTTSPPGLKAQHSAERPFRLRDRSTRLPALRAYRTEKGCLARSYVQYSTLKRAMCSSGVRPRRGETRSFWSWYRDALSLYLNTDQTPRDMRGALTGRLDLGRSQGDAGIRQVEGPSRGAFPVRPRGPGLRDLLDHEPDGYRL